MRLFVDTNILVDYLRMREPFFEPACLLATLGKIGEFELWISPSQLSDLFYILTNGGRKSEASAAKQQLQSIRSFVRICSLGEEETDRSLLSGWNDIEDSLVYEAARSIKADAIITRDQKDFAKSRIPVYDCGGFFDWLRNERGVDYDFIDL